MLPLPAAWALVCAALTALWWWVRRRSAHLYKTPQVVPGLPVLGNAIALGKGGLAFISQCRQQYGDVFCMRVLGQRMVFVFDPAMLTLFFKAPESIISFKPAVEQFTQRIYGLPSSEFFPKHEHLLATLRSLLVPAQLQDMGRALLAHAQPRLTAWRQLGQVELWSECQRLVFYAAGQVLFGPAFFTRWSPGTVLHHFLQFEGNFEVAASPIPHLLLPQFRRARKALLHMLSASLAAGDFKGTVVEQLLQGCGLPARLWPNLLLAVLWASQANSMPALFWSLALLLMPEQAEARTRVLQELQETADGIRKQQQQQQQQPTTKQQQQPSAEQALPAGLDEATVSAMLQLSLDKRSWVSRCVAEAIRLRVHSIAVRYVSDENLILTPSGGGSSSSSTGQASSGGASQPDKAGVGSGQAGPSGLHVPAGSILCICPIESHHDPRVYGDTPWAFRPDREPIQGLAAGTVVPGVAGMGFGGGFWRCPGRFFAEMELACLVQLVLLQLPDLAPLPQQQQQQQQQQSGDRGEVQAAGKQGRGIGALLPPALQQWVRDVAVYGLGACSGSRQQEQQWRASGNGGGACAGGGGAALPRCELRRLVGFKVPAEPWWVSIAGY